MKPWTLEHQEALRKTLAYYKKREFPEFPKCFLCETSDSQKICTDCAWVIMEGMTCTKWAKTTFNGSFFYVRAKRPKTFLKKRIKMLKRWIKYWEKQKETENGE